ncbi:pyridoxamine 5'-phosphate oxidase family protein [Haloglycomyces albus]|uniref:pyridoxamine 5'-phosphate oxidase family protein n=1 Tax=Haloglycomyces albus TaxID=526067 RepID=UPI00046CC2F0|nr:pyridoxamine 5'-phosphate oxidase family protein [Haloglycomyces albus]
MSNDFSPTARTTPRRHSERMGYEERAVHEVLDEALYCTVSFVGSDGTPQVIPTFHGRIGNRLYFHGSTGSTVGLADESGFAVAVNATVVDGLVFAKSWPNHSSNYRSVIAHGVARTVTDADEKWAAMRALIDRMEAGRSDVTRPPDAKEDAQVRFLYLDLDEVGVKVREGLAAEVAADATVDCETGIAPVRTVVHPRE